MKSLARIFATYQVTAILLLLIITRMANGSEFRISGYLKSSLSFLDESPLNTLSDPQTSTQKSGNIRFRLKLFSRISETLNLDLAYELSSCYQTEQNRNKEGIFFNTGAVSYRADDVTARVSQKEHGENIFYLKQNIDRFYTTLSYDVGDFYVGRQPISFGSGRFVNPTDVLTPFSFDSIDKEERIGVDAIRMKIPFGEMGEVDGGVVFGEDFRSENSALFLNTRFSINKVDYALMVMSFRENLLVGADFQTELLDAGYWLEAAYTFAGATGGTRSSNEDYLRISTGLDYNFFSNLYAFIEYHYNGAGENDPKSYLSLAGKTAYHEGQVYLLSRHYLSSGATCELTPLTHLMARVILNISDGSMFVSPQLEHSLMEDLYIEAGAFVSIGKKSRFSPGDIKNFGMPSAASEFGLYPNLYFISLRYYF